MNTKTASVLTGHPSQFQRMQRAELKWWTRYAAGANAIVRMYALYGMRYEPFWKYLEFSTGTVAEIGCGPMPVAALMPRVGEVILIDTLLEEYGQIGFTPATSRAATSTAQLTNDCADTVLLLNVLDHSEDPAALVLEAKRILKPGGRCLIFCHLENSDDKHRNVTLDEIMNWIVDQGFGIEMEQHKAATDYDPSAYLAVVTK